MAICDAYVFPGFLTLVLTQFFFRKPEVRGENTQERKKKCLNRFSNSQPPVHESGTLTTEQPGRGLFQTNPFLFMCLQYHSFENTVGKEEIARNDEMTEMVPGNVKNLVESIYIIVKMTYLLL